MLSRILNFQTLLNFFKTLYPISRLTSEIALKVFGCIAFVHDHEHGQGKLDPRARKCIFVGYAPTQKGYKCFDPISRKKFITMDVTFFEDKPFFENHLQGGARHVEELAKYDIFCNAYQNPDQNFTDFLEESPIPTNQNKSFRNNIPEKSDVSIQSTNEKEYETSENNDEALEKQISIENNKCLESLALVPINLWL